MKEKKSVKTFMIAIILLFQITIIASGNAKNYSHPQSTLAVDTLNMKVMVPAYFSSSALWARMATQSAKMPGRIYAIANLNNGPGTSVSSTYTTFINNMHTNFGKVIGYVWTSYGNIPLATAEADIDKWFSFYPTLDGIFFDGQSNTTGKETYYQTLYNYVKSKNAAGLVVANPGINTISNYLVYNGNRVSDVVCIFEAATGFDTWSPSSWTAGYSSDNFYVLPYNTTSSQWVSRLNRAISKNIGWIYLTDDTGANPWDTLPTYFEAYCDYIITGVYTPVNNYGLINIDGSFDDWQSVPKLNIPPNPPAVAGDSPYSDADYINFWATNDTANLFISYQVAGTISSNYFYQVFIDADTNVNTGYKYKDSASIGAELMVENDNLWEYTGTGGEDWSWSQAGGLSKANVGGSTEMSIQLANLLPSINSIRLIFKIHSNIEPYDLMEIDPENYKNQFYTFSFIRITGIKRTSEDINTNFILNQNYPNPFNPSTTIDYSVPKAGFVTIKVYDVLGRVVTTIVNENKPAGNFSVEFNASNLVSGIYFYRMESGSYTQTKKLLLLK